MDRDNRNCGGDEVEIVVKAIGPSRPSRIKIPSRIKVNSLNFDHHHLTFFLGLAELELINMILMMSILRVGYTNVHLVDAYGREKNECILEFKLMECIICATDCDPPLKALRTTTTTTTTMIWLFQIPESASRWKRRLFSFLSDKLKLPNIMLMALFSISLKAWGIIILWFTLAPVAYRWGLGPLYVLGTGFSIILLNLGQRQQGDLSAYSIFNEGFRELPGTLNADRIDRDIRAGQF
ncbi:hypothetical protein Syun_018302 [Stephania yunnanensis]|uniref:SAYSvFN domain-containing protein n=1 Tax=Stephania yunnanensis TaxID=152371 RepID=A0AAP0NWX0_9MAGN